MNSPAAYQPLVHRFAVLTAGVALLPICVGGLVTTMKAGMAFPDWPSSDGFNMVSYPWFQSTGDKFIEHGHRLAGLLIGIFSIALAGLLCWKESRVWVRWAGVAVLLCVIMQGILGGQRVLLNDLGLAFLHGSFANLVFALMAAVALFTSRGWLQANSQDVPAGVGSLQKTAMLTSILLFVQYVLGGLLRHLGWWPLHHLGFAFIVAFSVVLTVGTAHFSRTVWLRRPAYLLGVLLVGQLMLGAGAWVTKFGYDGYVAVVASRPQVIFQTAHLLVGVLIFMVSVVYLLRATRLYNLDRVERQSSIQHPLPANPLEVQEGMP